MPFSFAFRSALASFLWLALLLAPPLAMAATTTTADAATERYGCDSCHLQIDKLTQPHKLSGKWLFTREDRPENKEVVHDTRDWRLIQTPGGWTNAYGDGQKFSVGWYRGEFDFNPSLVGQEVVVLLNAYMGRVTVYIDGVEVYRRPGHINVDRYFSIQPIPIRFTVTRPHQVMAIRIDTPLMVGIYELPFELRKYQAEDHNLAGYQFWGGELRVIASYVILFFGLFFLRIYTQAKLPLYLVAALTSFVVFPFFAAPGDYLLGVFTPESLLAVHYIGLYALFLAFVFCQFFYQITPRLNWVLGSIYALQACIVSVSAFQGNLDWFQPARTAYFLTGAMCISLAFYQTVRGVLQKRQGALILGVGTFSLLVTAFHDMLLATGAIASIGLTFIGAMAFMGSMLYVASTTFTNTYLENQQLVKDLEAVNENLEYLVAERVETLSSTIETLQQTQTDLVEAEKLASLGALVAGVAHELNTPMGNAMVAASSLQDQMKQLEVTIANGQLRKSTFTDFLKDGAAISGLILKSCERASNLLRSFKQVAVDQTSEQRRTFNLRNLVDDVVTMLKPTLRHEPWHITVDVPDGIECDSYPGPMGQVLTNLIQNAAVHAFQGREHGHIEISAHHADGLVEVRVADDGQGMEPEILLHIFDPFFTTRLGKGGSGLGLSVSRNIALGVLGGSLTVTSTPQIGSCFVLTVPIVAPQPSEEL